MGWLLSWWEKGSVPGKPRVMMDDPEYFFLGVLNKDGVYTSAKVAFGLLANALTQFYGEPYSEYLEKGPEDYSEQLAARLDELRKYVSVDSGFLKVKKYVE